MNPRPGVASGSPAMIIQVYEIQSPVEARQMAALGVDHIGSVVVSESNWQTPLLKETVRAVQSAGARSSLIPLFSDREPVFRTLDYYRPDIVHFCQTLTFSGDISGDVDRYIQLQQDIRERFSEIRVMRTIPIGQEGCSFRVPTLKLAGLFEPVSDYFLTDTLVADNGDPNAPIERQQPVAGFVGITGITCDWQMARRLVETSRIPVILAGGIGPQNVAAGITAVQPAGVDSCTGTNAVGADGRPIRFQKDPAKVRAMVQIARSMRPERREKENSNRC